jgi:hypothetical protein
MSIDPSSTTLDLSLFVWSKELEEVRADYQKIADDIFSQSSLIGPQRLIRVEC